ncbi:MAG: FAD-binding protein [Bacteroidetes bacterium]|nr:FAD-binding protein [Bacteroidota bacterium]
MIQPDANGLYHPASESDIISLVQYAVQNKLQVRVTGAAQSVSGAIFTDGFSLQNNNPATNNINILLDQMRSVTFDDANMQVTVQAGCNLGFNPYDPAKVSTPENGLFYQLNQKGWSIQNVSDAIHQTVSGFISTASSAASLAHSFDECIVAVRIIDGNGTATTFTKSASLTDPFYGVGVSLGLLGIAVSVTLQCVPAFNIIGTETVTKTAECPFDFYGNGSSTLPSMQTFLTSTEFVRMLWRPISTLQRVITWQARTMQTSDYNQQTGPPNDFKPKPYVPIFHGPSAMPGLYMGSETVANVGYSLIANWPEWLYEIFGNNPAADFIKMGVNAAAPYLYPLLCDFYFPCNDSSRPPQQFWDNWLGSLPMDTVEFSNNLMDLVYTEFWIDINQTEQVINILQNYFTEKGMSATGFYCFEILGAKSSNFWLSPAYNQQSVRINIMQWLSKTVSPVVFYQQFWDLLKQSNINYRLHWGKYLPPPTSGENAAFITSQYPMWNNFIALRNQMDPNGIFLNTYWKMQLGI